MRAPWILLILSLAASLAALFVPDWSSLLLISLPSAVASLYLLVRGWFATRDRQRDTSRLRIAAKSKKKWAIIDGSNVMHWKEGAPDLATVLEVLAMLDRHGYSAGVVFDANAGYKLKGRYQDDPELARKLNLPASRVLVVPKGTPADPVILKSAADLDACIITNDRYRDWAESHPQVTSPGHLIRGGYRDGALWLDLG